LAQACELAPVADVALEDVPCRFLAERRMHLAGMGPIEGLTSFFLKIV
jgi:hypothetical protein